MSPGEPRMSSNVNKKDEVDMESSIKEPHPVQVHTPRTPVAQAMSHAGHWTPTQKKLGEETGRNEERLVQACAARLDHVMQTNPDWFAYFDDVQAMSANRADIAELLRCAPDEFTRGLMYGIFLMRSEMALITGRDFN